MIALFSGGKCKIFFLRYIDNATIIRKHKQLRIPYRSQKMPETCGWWSPLSMNENPMFSRNMLDYHNYTWLHMYPWHAKRYNLLFWETSSCGEILFHLQADDIGVCLKSVCSPPTPKIGHSSKNTYVTHRFEGNKSFFVRHTKKTGSILVVLPRWPKANIGVSDFCSVFAAIVTLSYRLDCSTSVPEGGEGSRWARILITDGVVNPA